MGYARKLEALEGDQMRNMIDEIVVWRPPPDSWVTVNFDVYFYIYLEVSSSCIIIRANNMLTMGDHGGSGGIGCHSGYQICPGDKVLGGRG